MQLDLFPMDAHLRCIDPTRNKRRFYRMSIQRNLFGEWVLMREWGRIGRAGRMKVEYFAQAARAAEALKTMAAAKQQRGYVALSDAIIVCRSAPS